MHVQNTVNAIVNNNLMMSEIDMNPSRYVVLNGLPADKDPNMKTGAIKENDSKPYYPYYDPSKHPAVNKLQQRYHNNTPLYPQDKRPYYGPTPHFIVNNPNVEGTKVKITMSNLDRKPTIENILAAQAELESLNKVLSYKGAYYDPTRTDKEKKLAELTVKLAALKNQLKIEQSMQVGENNTVFEIPPTKPHKITIENYKNVDVESTNKSIAQNFWYDVPRPLSDEERAIKAAQATAPVIFKNVSTNTKTIAQASADATTATTASTASTASAASAASAASIKSTTTTATTAATTTAATAKIPAATASNTITSQTSGASTTSSTPKATNAKSRVNHPDSQGLKTERVRIVSLRKLR